MDNKQCNCNKPKVVNDLLKRISNLEFEVEEKDRRIDKAIKYISGDNLPSGVYRYAEDFDFDKLLNILQGSDAN